MRNVIFEFGEYLERERHYDPIGSSDIIADAITWLRGQDVNWVLSNNPEQWYEEFRRSNIFAEYFGTSI